MVGRLFGGIRKASGRCLEKLVKCLGAYCFIKKPKKKLINKLVEPIRARFLLGEL